MSRYEEKFPALYQYLGGLFHQDWSQVFDWKRQTPDYKAVVRYFKIRDEKNGDEKEIEQLKRFLELQLSESEVEDVMDKWSIAYYPYGTNLTYLDWLKSVLEILEEPLEKTRKEFVPEFIG